jgi:MinD-like ATPase involved in chromosome partitioning or flagellar assembly
MATQTRHAGPVLGSSPLGEYRTSLGCCAAPSGYVRLASPAQSSTRRLRAVCRSGNEPAAYNNGGVTLEGKRAPQGLAAEDRLALGLTASHLSYLLVGCLAGYALFASRLPGPVKIPLGILCLFVGALLAWGRVARRPLDTWVWLALRYCLRPRRSPAVRPLQDPASPSVDPVAQGNTVDLLAADADELPGSQPPDSPVDPPAGPDTSDDGAPQARILTLPSPNPHVADGDAEYRVQSLPPSHGAPTESHSPPAAPVFLAATQRIAFFSLKGGVGKTTLATEVAALLAHQGRFRSRPEAAPEPLRVALLDVDLGSANVSMKVGLTHPTIWDLVLDPGPDTARVEGCLVTHDESGLRVLLGPPRAIAAAETRALAMQRLAQVLTHLEDEGYHFVFLDLSSDIDELTTYALEASHQIYYVMTPTASGVQDTYRGVETLRRLGHRRKLRFVLNQSRGGFDATEMLGDLGGSLAATIPRDDAFIAAEDEHRLACLAGNTAASRAVAELAASIYPNLEATGRRPGLWQRLRGRLG